MTNKNKRRLLKTILFIIFFIVVTIPFLDWHKKNKIKSDFNDIEFAVYQSMPNNDSNTYDLFYSYCDTVNAFLQKNPIEIVTVLNCEKYFNQQDTSRLIGNRTDFIEQVQKIDNEYRRLDRSANLRMLLFLIISQVFVALIRTLIDKKFKNREAPAV